MSSAFETAARRPRRWGVLLLLSFAVVVCAIVGFVLGARLMDLRGGDRQAGAGASSDSEVVRRPHEEMVARRLQAAASDEANRAVAAALADAQQADDQQADDQQAGPRPPVTPSTAAGVAARLPTSAAAEPVSGEREARREARSSARRDASERAPSPARYRRPGASAPADAVSVRQRLEALLDLTVVDPYPRAVPDGPASQE